MPTRQQVIQKIAAEYDREYVERRDSDRFRDLLRQALEEGSITENQHEKIQWIMNKRETFCADLVNFIASGSIPTTYKDDVGPLFSQLIVEIIPEMTSLTTPQKNALLNHFGG